jgi:transglutaminase-like putative cysteine protease
MHNKLGVVVLISSASAAWAAPPDRPDPAIVEQIKTIKPADYPSANTVSLLDRQDVVFQKDGTFAVTFRSIELVLTADGRERAAAHTLYYTKDAETYDIKTVRVIKRDGSAVEVPAKDILDTEQSGEANIYDPQGRAKKITVQGLAVGDAVEIEATMTRKLPTRENYFNDQYYFQRPSPVLESTVTIDGPASMPLTTQIYRPERGSKIVATKVKAGDRVRYTWTAKKIPQLVFENGMQFTQEVPALVVTTDPSWRNFSKWWAELTEKQMSITPELKAKAAELVKGKTTELEKVRALYDFVSSEIRYRGLGVGPRTGYTPRPAHDTMTSKWGVCRDVSILLTSMLRSQGIKAFPVLTNMGAPVLPKIAYDGFNHAIVALPKQGGGWTYLDPTAKNTADMLPGNEAEQSTLVSTLAGEKLTSIPALDPSSNMGHAKATTTIAADGAMTSTVKITGKGVFDQIMRTVGTLMSADQQKQIIEQIIHGALPAAKLVSFTTTPAMDMNTPIEFTIEISVPNAAVKAGEFRLLRTIVTSGALGIVEAILPQLLGSLPSRKYALDAQMTFRYDQDEVVTLPADMKIVAMPNDAKIDDSISTLASSCKRTSATQLDCRRSFSLKSRFIQPAQYAKLRSTVASLARVGRQPVVISGGAK